MKKKLSMLLALSLIVCLLAACAGTGGKKGETTVFRFGVEGEFTSLSPLVGGQVGYGTMMANGVYETLFVRENNEIVGRLATGYDWQDDNTLVIHLREGVKFHNGDDFTADDVLFSICLYGKNPQYANRLTPIDYDASYAEDAHTVVLKTGHYSAVLVGNLTSELMLMLDREWYDSLGGKIDQQANGTGPYCFQVWNMGTDFRIERNENYWNDSVKPYYDEIHAVFFNDATTAVLEYESGTLDAVYVQAAADIINLQNGLIKDSWCVSEPQHNIVGLAMSDAVGTEFLNNRVREAICHAIPVEQLVSGVAGGVVSVQNSAIPDDDVAHVDMDYYEYDPEYAASLIADEGPVKLTMVNVSNTINDAMAEAIQAYLAKIGIEVQLVSGNPPDIIPKYMAGEVNFAINQSGGGSDPADIFASMERGGNPCAELNSEEVLSLLDEAKVVGTEQERMELYRQVQQKIHDEFLFLPLYETSMYFAVSNDIASFGIGVGHYPDPATFAPAEA